VLFAIFSSEATLLCGVAIFVLARRLGRKSSFRLYERLGRAFIVSAGYLWLVGAAWGLNFAIIDKLQGDVVWYSLGVEACAFMAIIWVVLRDWLLAFRELYGRGHWGATLSHPVCPNERCMLPVSPAARSCSACGQCYDVEVLIEAVK